MLQLTDVTLHRGDKAVFERLNLTIYDSHKVGVVGRNGAGKTTLFDVIRRRLQPEEGTVEWPRSWRLAALDQYVEPSPKSALDFVLDGDAELRRVERAIAAAEKRGDDHALGMLYSDYEDVGGYDAHARGGEILGGLGFARDDFDKAHREFSGGWRIRLHLARALMTPSDFLLLDEPTNHLDLEATLWLESWVRKYRGTLLTIAHDRDFLDRTVQEIVHLDGGQAALYSGDYSGFERQRAEALVRQAAVYKHQQQRIGEIQRFVDRFRAKASKARQVQSRVKTLERMEKVAPVHAESPYRFAFTQPKKISNPTLMLDDVSLGYDGNAVLDEVTLRVYPSDRIGVLGVNGAGKTTLLRCLADELPPVDGGFTRGRHSSVGYFAQHQLESLDLHKTPLEHIDEATGEPGMTSQQALDYLGGWGFHGDDVRRPAETFSGGEESAPGPRDHRLPGTGGAGSRRAHEPPRPGDARGARNRPAAVRGRAAPGLPRPAPAPGVRRRLLARRRSRRESVQRGSRCLRRVAPGTTVQGSAAQQGGAAIRCSPAGAEAAQDRGRHRDPHEVG